MDEVNKRKTVVVAGGTGEVGRHIVDGIVAAKKYTVKVFTRHDSSSSTTGSTVDGVQIVKVDYSDYSSLVKELQGVHTVIVCLISTDDSSIQSQVNLLNASLEAKVKRFAPSEFAGNNDASTAIELYRKIKVPVTDKVKASGIEYALFMNGVFMDYFASPQKASPYLKSFSFGVDFNKCEANIVDTGDEPFCVTRAEDVGRFVTAALDLEKWDERLGMVGSRTTWNELIQLGEKLRGKKFNVKRTTVDQTLSALNPKATNPMTNFYQEALVAISQGEFDIQATLNGKFPQIKPTSVEEFLNKWWAGKEGQTF